MNEQLNERCTRCYLFVRGNHTCFERSISGANSPEIVRRRRDDFLTRLSRNIEMPVEEELNFSPEPNSTSMLISQELISSFIEWQINRMPEYQRHRYIYSEIVRNLYNEFTNHVTKEIKETPVKIDECSICYMNITDSNVVELNCNHQFCGNCVNELFKLKCEPMCALCREPIKNVSSNQEIITNI
jgi:hypothetical protein